MDFKKPNCNDNTIRKLLNIKLILRWPSLGLVIKEQLDLLRSLVNSDKDHKFLNETLTPFYQNKFIFLYLHSNNISSYNLPNTFKTKRGK
jgi:hypothetical protein